MFPAVHYFKLLFNFYKCVSIFLHEATYSKTKNQERNREKKQTE